MRLCEIRAQGGEGGNSVDSRRQWSGVENGPGREVVMTRSSKDGSHQDGHRGAKASVRNVVQKCGVFLLSENASSHFSLACDLGATLHAGDAC